MPTNSQRNVMRGLVERFGADREKVIQEYAAAERRGEVKRTRNERGIEPDDYAARLWADAIKKGWLDEGAGSWSQGGVRIANTFRDNLIIDRYDAGFLTMRGAKTESMRSENSEDALTWNVFRSLAQVDPGFWYPRLFQLAFRGVEADTPRDVGVRLWVRLSPPPTLRLHQKDEGDSEIDVMIETERAVWCIEAKYRSDVSERTTNNPNRDQVIRNLDVGSWYAGVRDFYFSLLVLELSKGSKGVTLVQKYGNREIVSAALPHRHDGVANLRGVGMLAWRDLCSVLGACAAGAPRADERGYAERAVEWLGTKKISSEH